MELWYRKWEVIKNINSIKLKWIIYFFQNYEDIIICLKRVEKAVDKTAFYVVFFNWWEYEKK